MIFQAKIITLSTFIESRGSGGRFKAKLLSIFFPIRMKILWYIFLHLFCFWMEDSRNNLSMCYKKLMILIVSKNLTFFLDYT